mgnify:FL=1
MLLNCISQPSSIPVLENLLRINMKFDNINTIVFSFDQSKVTRLINEKDFEFKSNLKNDFVFKELTQLQNLNEDLCSFYFKFEEVTEFSLTKVFFINRSFDFKKVFKCIKKGESVINTENFSKFDDDSSSEIQILNNDVSDSNNQNQTMQSSISIKPDLLRDSRIKSN